MSSQDQIDPLVGLGATQIAVIRHIRKMGSVPRSDIAQTFGITPAAVSLVTRELIGRGIVREGARRRGGRGAPHVDLTLSGSIGYALGVHASRHSIMLTLLDYSGTMVGERHVQGAYDSFNAVREAVVEGARALLASAGAERRGLVGAGVALPTRFYKDDKSLDLADEVLSWSGTDLSSMMSQALDCPISFENDANAAAIGELSLGNSHGHRNFAYLYLSEGIGSGIVLGSSLYRGNSGNAGEIGGLRTRGVSRPSFDDLAHWCADRAQTVPAGRDPLAWTRFLIDNPSLLDSWLERAGPELAEMGYAVAAILAPDAMYLGGTLPAVVRERMMVWLDFGFSKPAQRGRVVQPQILLPDVVATDAVAFGAAAMVLHS